MRTGGLPFTTTTALSNCNDLWKLLAQKVLEFSFLKLGEPFPFQ